MKNHQALTAERALPARTASAAHVIIFPKTFRPRENRNLVRANAARERALASGMKALDAAKVGIEALGQGHEVNYFKLTVQRVIQKGYCAENRARYWFYILNIASRGMSLDEAIAYVREEIANAPKARTRLGGMIRTELLLVLRWLRFKNMAKDFADTVAAERAPKLEAAE